MINLHPFPIFFLLLLLLILTCGQTTVPDSSPVQSSFRPSVAVVLGIFSILFSLTFLLLMYAKFCHSSAFQFFNHTPTVRHGLVVFPPHRNINPDNVQQGRLSGIDKSVIESLPFFRFSSLKGSRDGLECAVCLSRFDEVDVLRLLPKCKHAFHIGCVDKWLECHSTCPLCRYRIDPDDANVFKCSNSSRFLFRGGDDNNNNNNNELENVEILVERERDDRTKKDEFLIQGKERHRFKHRIILSDAVFKSRWSDMNSTDLVSLSSDMLGLVSSRRFKVNDENSTPARCMSEITNVTRFHGAKNGDSNSEDDEKVRRVWLPIARRTVQLFAGRERRAEFQHGGGDSDV